MKRLTFVLCAMLCGGAARADLSRDLLAAYFFQGSGQDSSGRGQDAQFVGATLTTDRHGRPDGAVYLDGEGAYVATPVSGKRFPVSFSFWFRLDSRPGARPFSIVDSGIGDAFGHSFVIGSGPERFNANLAANFGFRKGVWTHVAITYGPQLRVYLDGQLVAHKEHSEDDGYVAGNFQIGRHFGSEPGRYFHGAVDDVLIYERTLNDAEVADLFAHGAQVEQHVQLAAAAKAELATRLGTASAGTAGIRAEERSVTAGAVTVAVSSGAPPETNGWAAVDGDTNTVWSGAAHEPGWWLAVEYDPPVTVSGLDLVFGDGSATNVVAYYSADADNWPELLPALQQAPAEMRFLLLTFPADDGGRPPRIAEIHRR